MAMPGRLLAADVWVLDSLRLSAWLLFRCACWRSRRRQAVRSAARFLILVLGFCGLAVGNDARIVLVVAAMPAACPCRSSWRDRVWRRRPADWSKNLCRNTEPERRWHVWPICIALGGMFAYELFLFSDRFSPAAASMPAALGRPIVAASWCRCWRWRWRATANGGSTSMCRARWCCIPPPWWRAALSLVASRSSAIAAASRRRLGAGAAAGDAVRQLVVLATVLSSGSLRRRLK